MDEEIQLLANVVESSDDAIISKSLDGVITSWNKGAEIIYGYSVEEVIGKNISILAPPQLKDEVNQLIKKIKDGKKVYHYDTIRISKDSKQIDVSISLSPIFDNSGNLIGISTIARDITKQKKIELALKESEEKYRSIFENSMDAVLLIKPNGTILDVNPAGEKLFGYTKKEMIKLGRQGIIDSDDPRLPALIEEREHKGKAKGELIFVKKDGSKFSAEISSNIFREKDGIEKTIMVINDISDRLKAEETLKESELKYKEIFNNVNDQISLIEIKADGFPGKFIEMNEVGIKRLGYSRDELSTMTVIDLIAPDKHSEIPKNIIELQNRGHATFETVNITKDGKKIPVEISNHLFEINGKKVALAITRDITERNKALESLQKSESDLLRAQKLGHLGSWEWNIQKNTLEWSKELYNIFAVNKDFEFTFESIENMIHPEDREKNLEIVKGLLKHDNEVEYEFRIIRPNREIRYVHQIINVVKRDGNGNAKNAFGIMQDITERKKAEKSLADVYLLVKKQSAELIAANVVLKAEIKERKRMEIIIRDNVLRMNLALESADMGALDLDILNDTSIRTLDHDKIFGYDLLLPEWGLKIFFEHVLSEDREYVQERFEKSYETNKLYFQCRIIRADKEIRWIEAYGNVYKDDKGVPNRILGVISDITERKETEIQLLEVVEEKELLLREIHHRVKNNMQIISSLLNLQSSQVFDKRDTDLFTVVQDRVKSMGLIHGSLYQSEDLSSIKFKEYVNTLTYQLLTSYAVNSKIKLVTNIDDISLNIETAIPLGLIINELVTNSLKHGFPDSEGEISINVHVKGEEIELIFKDNGAGLPEDFDIKKPKKLGLKLVNSLVEQIEGTIELDKSHGTEFKITFKELKYKERL